MTRMLALAVSTALLTACGGGVPIQIRIDEFTLDLDMDEAMAVATEGMQSSNLLPAGTSTLPELWPESLPDIEYSLRYPTPPVPVDLTPEPGSEEAEKYAEINEAEKAIERIEINRLVMRIEQSNLSIGLPEMILQVADAPDADPDDRRAWFTIGHFPGTEESHFVGDIEFEWVIGGESLLNSQLMDDTKEFALRAVGDIHIDTEANPAIPSGLGLMRLIVVATFFVEPTEAL